MLIGYARVSKADGSQSLDRVRAASPDLQLSHNAGWSGCLASHQNSPLSAMAEFTNRDPCASS